MAVHQNYFNSGQAPYPRLPGFLFPLLNQLLQAISIIVNSAIVFMNNTMPLYAALKPDNKYDIVFEQTPARSVTITLRPLRLPADWPYISNWLHREFGRRFSSLTHLPDKYLRETLSIMLQCDFAQPFVGLINNHPSFLVEICDGDKQCDALDDAAPGFQPGDHVMRLLLSHPVMHTRFWSEYALYNSLDYFFSHQQVQRIVWQLHEKDKFYITLATQSGFTMCPCRPGIQVFLYQREKFRRFFATYHQHLLKLP